MSKPVAALLAVLAFVLGMAAAHVCCPCKCPCPPKGCCK